MDFLCTFQKYMDQSVSKTSDHIKIKIRIPNPSHEPPVSSKAPNQDSKDLDGLCTFKIKVESWNFYHGCIKDQSSYPNQDKHTKSQSGTSSVLQNQKWGLKGHGFPLRLQNQDWEPKLRIWVYQRPVTIAKSTSRCKTSVRNLQHPPKPQSRT